MEQVLLVVLGGILSTLGGAIAISLQAKQARRIRMDELIAEKKIEANQQAYTRIKTIASMLVQSTTKDVRSKMHEYEPWFFDSRLFLPGEFPNKWLSIRLGLDKLLMLEEKTPSTAEEATQLYMRLRDLAAEAIQEIYGEMKLKRLEVPIPWKSRGKAGSQR